MASVTDNAADWCCAAEGPHSSDEEEEDLEEQHENPGQQQEQLADDQAEQVPQEEEAHLQQIPEEEQEEQPGANHATEMPEPATARVLDFVPVLPAPSASPTASRFSRSTNQTCLVCQQLL